MGPLNTPNQAPGNDDGMTPSQFMGEDPSMSEEQGFPGDIPGATPDAQANALGAVTQQVRDMEQGLQALAQQFPVAAPEVRRATEAVRDVLKRIVSSPADQEPPAPRSLA